MIRSENYNFNFDKKTGFFQRWGKTLEDNPEYSAFGPEILDIEVTTICHGVTGLNGKKAVCNFCYKSNTPCGVNMSLDTFKKVLDKISESKTITQLAIGADSSATSNPDLFPMMEYSRSKGIIPNITVAEISDEVADKLAKYTGAVAVSRYENKNICYDSVKKLTDCGMNQVNIHVMLSSQSFDIVMETLKDRMTDPRLSKLNAIVILSLKQKGRGEKYTCATQEQFKTLVDFALENKIAIGFDSCSAHKFLKSIEGHKDYKKFEELCEPCESSMYSSFVDVHGKYFPCSFTPDTGDWKEGMDVENCKNFVKDVWNNPKTIKFRNTLLKCGRNCPLFKI
jgi:hypothetical protein